MFINKNITYKPLLISPLTTYLYSYLSIDNKHRNISKVVWTNDIINHPLYSEYINKYRNFKKFINTMINEKKATLEITKTKYMTSVTSQNKQIIETKEKELENITTIYENAKIINDISIANNTTEINKINSSIDEPTIIKDFISNFQGIIKNVISQIIDKANNNDNLNKSQLDILKDTVQLDILKDKNQYIEIPQLFIDKIIYPTSGSRIIFDFYNNIYIGTNLYKSLDSKTWTDALRILILHIGKYGLKQVSTVYTNDIVWNYGMTMVMRANDLEPYNQGNDAMLILYIKDIYSKLSDNVLKTAQGDLTKTLKTTNSQLETDFKNKTKSHKTAVASIKHEITTLGGNVGGETQFIINNIEILENIFKLNFDDLTDRIKYMNSNTNPNNINNTHLTPVQLPREYHIFKQFTNQYIDNGGLRAIIKSSNNELQTLLNDSMSSSITTRLYGTLDELITKYTSTSRRLSVSTNTSTGINNNDIDSIINVGIVSDNGVKSISINVTLAQEEYTANDSFIPSCDKQNNKLGNGMSNILNGTGDIIIETTSTNGSIQSSSSSSSNILPPGDLPIISDKLQGNELLMVISDLIKTKEYQAFIKTPEYKQLAVMKNTKVEIEKILSNKQFIQSNKIIHFWRKHQNTLRQNKIDELSKSIISEIGNSDKSIASIEIDIKSDKNSGIPPTLETITIRENMKYDNKLVKIILNMIQTEIDIYTKTHSGLTGGTRKLRTRKIHRTPLKSKLYKLTKLTKKRKNKQSKRYNILSTK
jgi:hypothetical protein